MATSSAATKVRMQQRALLLLRALVDSLSSSARAVERRTGVTNAQLFLLHELAASGPLGIGELAVRARTQPSTVSIVVSRLARAGLLTKARGRDDARRAIVRITEAGRRLARHAPVPPTARLLDALDRLPAREAAGLARGR